MAKSAGTGRWIAIVVLSTATFVAAWLMQPDSSSGPCVTTGSSLLPEIPEASGLAISRRQPSWLWAHNDSGNASMLFAIDPDGIVAGRLRVPIETRDWEDISAVRCGDEDCLLIADIGDNRSVRPEVRIYRVREPRAGDAQTETPERFTATYTDGPHNAESMFVIGQELFIVTRDRNGFVYRSPLPATGSALSFRRVGQLGLRAVSDAETSREGDSVVVRTAGLVAVYRSADLLNGTFVPYSQIAVSGLKEPQGEGVALDGNALHLASEGNVFNGAGRLVSLRCDMRLPTPKSQSS